VAGAFVKSNWGLSFTVPGVIIGGVGFLVFLLLVPFPEVSSVIPLEVFSYTWGQIVVSSVSDPDPYGSALIRLSWIQIQEQGN
jgi:hypothetical protein